MAYPLSHRQVLIATVSAFCLKKITEQEIAVPQPFPAISAISAMFFSYFAHRRFCRAPRTQSERGAITGALSTNY